MPDSVTGAQPEAEAGAQPEARTTLPSGSAGFGLTAPALLVLSGAPGSGKTTLSRMAAALARRRNLSVAGLLSLPYRHPRGGNWRRVADAGTGEWRLLGQFHDPNGDETPPQGAGPPSWAAGPVLAWDLDPRAVNWADRRLTESGAMAPDLLIIDEVGPLELLWDGGWKSAPRVLARGRFRLAIVAVRPGLASALFDALAREPQQAEPAAVQESYAAAPGAAPEASTVAPPVTRFVLDLARVDHAAAITFVRQLIEDLGNGAATSATAHHADDGAAGISAVPRPAISGVPRRNSRARCRSLSG